MAKKTFQDRSVIHGILSSLSLILVYFTIVGLFQGMAYAINRFVELWYLMTPLVAGFGFQIGLFSYIRNFMMMKAGTVGISGGASAISMVACCAHHITDVIPILGVSALGIFLLEYQPLFLVLGIISNLAGIFFMMDVAKKGGVKFRNGILKNIIRYDYGKLFKITIIAGIFVLIVSALFIGYQWYQKYYGKGYSSAVSSELENKCATPPGYTDESWREHMGHHPDRYKECLGG
ncbi:MAG: hypothetical protein HYW23_02525 [Candidatus Aenigmarchaeota archaeon]|nr:hypothetical protein [Candidatus Aenigmarchaeota archaeon]